MVSHSLATTLPHTAPGPSPGLPPGPALREQPVPRFRGPGAHRLPSCAHQAGALCHPHPAGLAAELGPPSPTQASSPEWPIGQKEATSLGGTSRHKDGASLEQQGSRRPWEEGAGEAAGGRGDCGEKRGGPALLLPGSNNRQDPRPRACPGQPPERWASGCLRPPPGPVPSLHLAPLPGTRHRRPHRPETPSCSPGHPSSALRTSSASLAPRYLPTHGQSGTQRPPTRLLSTAPELPALDPSSLEGGQQRPGVVSLCAGMEDTCKFKFTCTPGMDVYRGAHSPHL